MENKYVEIEFTDIVSGDDKRLLCEILPSLQTNFSQRKQYDEYYFMTSKHEVTLDNIIKISDNFPINISCGTITIKS